MAVAVEAAWAGGGWMTRVDERKNAKDARRMVNDRRSFSRARRVFGAIDRNKADFEEDDCSAPLLWPIVMLVETRRR